MTVFFLETFHFIATKGKVEADSKLHAKHTGYLLDRLWVQKATDNERNGGKQIDNAKLVSLLEKWQSECKKEYDAKLCQAMEHYCTGVSRLDSFWTERDDVSVCAGS